MAHPCASGFSYNIGSVATGDIVNIEVAPNSTFSILNITEGDSCHFNEYIRLNVDQFPDVSSAARLARVEQMPAPVNPYDIITILGDTKNKSYPIYRYDL